MNGVSFVNITDPANPIVTAKVGTATNPSDWADIKVNGNYAYVVTEAAGHHVRVFDLTQLENVTNPPLTLEYEDQFGTVGNGDVHNIVLNEELGYAVTVGSGAASGGLVFHDISNPPLTAPTIMGQYSGDGYSHDAVCFIYRGVDTEHIGKEICIGFNTNTYTIVDVSNKSNPIQLSRTGYIGSRYTHQGWMTDDQKFLFLNDELDETNTGNKTTTFIFDISDLDNPSSTPFHKFESTTNAIDHNLYIKGSYVYQANYRAGLRILDIQNLETGIGNDKVTEVAYFDVFPSNDNASFNGSWGVYPFFKSGNVVISSIEQGLFVVQPKLEHFVVDLTSASVQTMAQNGTATYELDITAYGGFSNLVDLEVTNLPVGLTAIFSQNIFTPNGISTLILTGTGTTPIGNYSLEITGTPVVSSAPTQRLRVGVILSNAVLPVTWTDFSAKVQEDIIQLDWTTANELNNQGFEVERSIDTGQGFKKIAWVAGKGTTSQANTYRFSDKNVQIGQTYYYRLRQIDEDGQANFSSIVSAQIKATETTITLRPNPANELVQIQILGEIKVQPIHLDLITLDGKIVQRKTDINTKNTFILPLEGLESGIYIIRIQLEDGVVTERLVLK